MERPTEAMINVSVASSAVDPLLASVCKTGEVNPLETIDEDIPEHATTSIESEISGINLLDQTSESIFSEALVLSDSDSVDKNVKDEEKENGTIHDAIGKIDQLNEVKMQESAAEKLVPNEENMNKSYREDKDNMENISFEDKSEEKEDFPVMLIDSDTDSDDVIEETPVKSKIVAKVGDIPAKLQKVEEDDNQFVGAITAVSSHKAEIENVPAETIKAEFVNFQENVVHVRQRCSTPDQRRIRAKLSRKTLGDEEDVKITLNLELEKADLEKAKLIEAYTNKTLDKESSAICVKEGNVEEETTVETDVCLPKDNVEMKETKSIDAAVDQVVDEDDSVICIEENSDMEEEKTDVLKEEEILQKDKAELEESKLMEIAAVKEKPEMNVAKTKEVDVSLQKELEDAELTEASSNHAVRNDDEDVEVICAEEKKLVEEQKADVVDESVPEDEVLNEKEIVNDVESNTELATTADVGAADAHDETECVIAEKVVLTALKAQSIEASSGQNRDGIEQEVSAIATPVEVTEAAVERPIQIIEDISSEGAVEDNEILSEREKESTEKVEVDVSTISERQLIEDDRVSSSSIKTNEVTDKVEKSCEEVVLIANAPEFSENRDDLELTENKSGEIWTTEITQQKAVAVDEEENVVAKDIEHIVDVEVHVKVNDNKESTEPEETTAESKAQTTETPAKRRTRKGSRATKQTSTNDESSTMGVIAEIAQESEQVIISTDYEIKIRDTAKTEDEKVKSEEVEHDKAIEVTVVKSEVAESRHVQAEDPTENIEVKSEPLKVELPQAAEESKKQITPVDNTVTEADTKSAEIKSESQRTVTEIENVQASTSSSVELEATVVAKDEPKVRKRTRKGSQSSQCSTHEESGVIPRRRGGRRRAETPTETVAENLNSSESIETVITETTDMKKRLETGLEKVKEVVNESESDELDTMQEPTAVAIAQEAQTIVTTTSTELDHPVSALNIETCAVEVEPRVESEIKAVSTDVEVAVVEPSVPETKNVANEEQVAVEENKEETLIEKEAPQKRNRRKAQNTDVTQSSSFIDTSEVSTSRRRRGRKNTEDSNAGKIHTGIMESQSVKDTTKETTSVLVDNETDLEVAAETFDAAAGATGVHNDERKGNESETPDSVVEVEEEAHSTQETSKRQVRGKRNRKVSANTSDETEIATSIHLQIVEEATSSAKKPVRRARTTRRKHPETIANKEGTTDSHENKDDSLPKQTEEDIEKNSLKTEVPAEIAAPRRSSEQKAYEPAEVVVTAPKRRGGKRKQDEPSDNVGVEEHVTTHGDVTADNSTKSTRRKKVYAEIGKVESELHDAPGDDETEDDHEHDAAQKGTRKRRGAAVATVAPKRAVRGRAKRNQHEDEIKTLTTSLTHPVQSQAEVLHTENIAEESGVAGELVTSTEIPKTESKSRLRKRNESHVEEDHVSIVEETKPSTQTHIEVETALSEKHAEVKRGRRRRESLIDLPEEQIEIAEEIKSEVTEEKVVAKPKGRKRRESHIEQQKNEAPSDEPPQKRDAVTALQTESKPETPQHVKAAPRRTRKASALIDSSHHSSHESDLSTGTPQRVRSRNVPRRSATAQDHNYDESSDTEAQAEFKRRLERRVYVVEKDNSTVEKPTTSRGRTRKPTALVEEYLEKERVKAGTPKRRLLLTARTETPTTDSRQEPARRARKASTIEVETVSTPQATTKRARGKAAATLVKAMEASEGSRSETEHISGDLEETQSSSQPEEKEVSSAPSKAHSRRRGKAAEKQDVAIVETMEQAGEVKASDQQEAVVAEAATKRVRGRGRGQIATIDQESKDSTTVEEEKKPRTTGRGRGGTRSRKGKVDKTESQEEQQETSPIISPPAVEGAMNEEDSISVGIAASSDSHKMDTELDEEEDKPLAEMAVKAVKRTAATRRNAGGKDSPAVKRSRRKPVTEDAVAHVTSDAATGRRGRKVVRFEPADSLAANPTIATASTSTDVATEESTATTEAEATVVPPKRATRTRRK